MRSDRSNVETDGPNPRPRSLAGRTFVTVGLRRRIWQDLYHLFMTVRWPTVFASFAAFFFLFNLVFAAIYTLQPEALANLNPPGYWGRFFFSVETFATVGYGDMHPRTMFGHVVASIEILFGMLTLALITGMMFARFSRPTARFLFARYAVIRPFEGRLTLMLRAANARQNIVMEASAQLRLLRDEVSPEGDRFRRLYDLPLVRNQQPAFLFGWTMLHTIDATSPLAGATAESLAASNTYLVLTIGGVDETTGQRIIARHEYPGDALRWNHTFADVLTTGTDGVDRFDYSKFHETRPIANGMSARPSSP